MTKTAKSTDSSEITDFVDINDTSEGITFDRRGFLYVTSYINGEILKISDSKQISKFADKLVAPAAIAFDRNDNFYVCECGKFIKIPFTPISVWTKIPGKLTRISPDGTKKSITEADDGAGLFGNKKRRKIKHPNGIAIKSNGIVYVSEMSGFVARIDGNNTKVLFSFRNWLPIPINFMHSPNGMALSQDETILYVNDVSSGAIWKVSLDQNGNYLSKSKLNLTVPSGDGIRKSKSLPYADGIALDSEGNLYVTYNLKHIAKVNPETGEVKDLYSGNGLKIPANIAFGYGEGFDNQSIYITQLGSLNDLPKKEGATIIKKMHIGIPGMVLPPFT